MDLNVSNHSQRELLVQLLCYTVLGDFFLHFFQSVVNLEELIFLFVLSFILPPLLSLFFQLLLFLPYVYVILAINFLIQKNLFGVSSFDSILQESIVIIQVGNLLEQLNDLIVHFYFFFFFFLEFFSQSQMFAFLIQELLIVLGLNDLRVNFTLFWILAIEGKTLQYLRLFLLFLEFIECLHFVGKRILIFLFL